MVEGSYATLKTYFKEDYGIRLHPENPAYEDIPLKHEEFLIGQARIIGKMVGIWTD